MRRIFLLVVLMTGLVACSAAPQASDVDPVPLTKDTPADPVAELKAGCDTDHAGDCMNLGFRYERGQGVEVNPARAHELYDKACVLGSPHACYAQALVMLYEENNPVRAQLLLEYTCDGGYNPACIALGDLYREGFGVIKKEGKALGLYRKACEGGDHSGCSAFNTHLWTASKQLESLDEYVTFLGKQCDAGHPGSCVELGKIYRDGARWVGYEITPDDQKSRDYFAQAGRLKRLVGPVNPIMLSTKPPVSTPQNDVADATPKPAFKPGVIDVKGTKGLEIVVDSIATGKKTPNTVLILKTGKHSVQVRDAEGKLSPPVAVFIESGTHVELSF